MGWILDYSLCTSLKTSSVKWWEGTGVLNLYFFLSFKNTNVELFLCWVVIENVKKLSIIEGQNMFMIFRLSFLFPLIKKYWSLYCRFVVQRQKQSTESTNAPGPSTTTCYQRRRKSLPPYKTLSMSPILLLSRRWRRHKLIIKVGKSTLLGCNHWS